MSSPSAALTLVEPAPPIMATPSPGLNFHDILFILWRHKIKILLFLFAGMAAAGIVHFFLPSPFESQAKLLVRYVVERSAVDGVVGSTKGEEPPLDAPNESALNSEVEILTSSDLALEVAQTIGLDRLSKGNGKKLSSEGAALAIQKAMDVTVINKSNIISVTYKDKDPELAVDVLDAIIKKYLEKHLEVHRSVGGYDFVSQEANRLQVELTKTENDLKQLKEKYNVATIGEAIKANEDELNKAEADFNTTQADLASQKAHVAEIDKFFHAQELANAGNSIPTPPDAEIINRYQGLVGQLEILRKAQTDLLNRYTADSRMAKGKQAKLDELEKQKVDLERKYPSLITTVAAAAGSANSATTVNEIILERARLAGLVTRSDELKSNVETLRQRARDLNEVAPKITELERTRDVQETSYRYYGTSLEKARVDAGLNPSHMPNINVVQNPSPATRSTKDLKKIVIGLVGGGLISGLGLAILIELVLDRTVKRARELEARLQLPLMLTIPAFGRLRLANHNGSEDTEAAIEPEGEFLRPFCEAIRDRLSLFFEATNLARKPKLIAVTSLSKNAGVSTLAAGLAETLSEAGENKVLLVDEPMVPKRFYRLMSQYKESALDYVIFDMPSIGDTTSTLPMAGFMDKVLLVVEAAKSGRETVKRAYTQLSAKTDVSVIFNKSRSYGPKWLEGEL
jgi:uncharacterized protein involved in exopolysaccharide biosynthesis